MNKKQFMILPLVVLLVSCGGVGDLYEAGAYDTGDFSLNYYTEWNKDIKDKSEIFTNTTLSNDNMMLWNRDQNNYRPSDYGELKYPGISPNKATGDGVDFGYSNALNDTVSEMSYGYTSRLFDGRVDCQGHYAKSRMQLKESGMSMLFPKTITSAKYMAISIRGGSNHEINTPRVSQINMSVVLYKYDYNNDKYTGDQFNFNDIDIYVDSSGSYVSLYGLYFTGANSVNFGSNHANGYVGMSIEYDLVYDEVVANDSSTQFALMVHEVLFPDSTWN